MKLRAQSIAIAAPRELCFEVVAAAGKRLEKRSEEEWVVEFVTEVGGRTVRTVELLTLDRPRSIRYEWLEGPLRKVDEAMGFMPTDEGTLVTYGGSFSIGMGPVGWVIGLLRVKPLFDRLVEEHLEQAKEIAEKRAARSKVHGKQPSSGDGTDGKGDRFGISYRAEARAPSTPARVAPSRSDARRGTQRSSSGWSF